MLNIRSTKFITSGPFFLSGVVVVHFIFTKLNIDKYTFPDLTWWYNSVHNWNPVGASVLNKTSFDVQLVTDSFGYGWGHGYRTTRHKAFMTSL
jgi:hypothetical protein